MAGMELTVYNEITRENDQLNVTHTGTDLGAAELSALTPEKVFCERPTGTNAAISVKTSAGFEGCAIQTEKEPQLNQISDASTSVKTTFTEDVAFVRINDQRNGNTSEVTINKEGGRAYFKTTNGGISGTASVGDDKAWSKWFWNKLTLKY